MVNPYPAPANAYVHHVLALPPPYVRLCHYHRPRNSLRCIRSSRRTCHSLAIQPSQHRSPLCSGALGLRPRCRLDSPGKPRGLWRKGACSARRCWLFPEHQRSCLASTARPGCPLLVCTRLVSGPVRLWSWWCGSRPSASSLSSVWIVIHHLGRAWPRSPARCHRCAC